MEFRCWLCESKCATLSDLKRHLAGPRHVRLHVVCPWCTESVKTLRVWDLKRHVDKVHPGVDMLVPADMFKEPTLFYFAAHPVDYARVIRPTHLEHKNSIAAMTAMRSLLNSHPGGELKSRQDWEEGWLQAMATPLTSERPEDPLQYRASVPVYAPTGFGARCVSLPNTPGPSGAATVPEAYSPTRPAIGDTIHIIHVDTESLNVYLHIVKNLSTGFRVTLSSSVRREQDTVLSLQNLVDNPLDYNLAGATTPVDSGTYSEIVDLVTEKIGLAESCVDSVDRYVTPPSRRPILRPLTVPRDVEPTPTPTCSPQAVTPRIELAPTRTEEAAERCALSMLGQGVMPLLPPAPRMWSGDEEVTFHGAVNTIKWPPKGWKEFTPSRRRQAFEFSAMLLDVGRSGFPETEPKLLLAKYNFLRLPGSQKGNSTSSNQRMLFHNFNALRKVATSQEQNPTLVKMFANAAKTRDTSTDRYIRVMDAAKLKLRLKV